MFIGPYSYHLISLLNRSSLLNLQALKDLVARNITDALQLVILTRAKPRMTETDELVARSGNSFRSTLSRSQSRDSWHMSHGQNKIKTLSRNLSNNLQMTRLSPVIQTGHGHRRSASETLAFQLENAGISSKSEGFKKPSSDTKVEYALIIDGQSLAFILAEPDLQEQFLRVCINCASVLCCRVSPRQKAQVTKLVRKGLGHHRLCLAIGDGANDVGMIQAANVGVGITGVEGAQVVFLSFTINYINMFSRNISTKKSNLSIMHTTLL